MGVLGWTLLNHSSQKGQPARSVDQGCPKVSEGQTGVAEFQREAWEPPREAGFHVITGQLAVFSQLYSVQKGPVSWRLGLRTPWMTTPGAERKREL